MLTKVATLRITSLVSLAGAFLSGCVLSKGYRDRRHAEAESRLVAQLQAPLLIGSVVLVNEELGFVLIDNEAKFSPPLGKVVQARRDAVESAELRLTEIRRRPFIIADILKGSPRRGDEVFFSRRP